MTHFCVYCGNPVSTDILLNTESNEKVGIIYTCFQCDREVSEHYGGKIISIPRSGRLWSKSTEDEEEG
jgi:hypothetical protein